VDSGNLICSASGVYGTLSASFASAVVVVALREREGKERESLLPPSVPPSLENPSLWVRAPAKPARSSDVGGGRPPSMIFSGRAMLLFLTMLLRFLTSFCHS
jgi:hypothetical protein